MATRFLSAIIAVLLLSSCAFADVTLDDAWVVTDNGDTSITVTSGTNRLFVAVFSWEKGNNADVSSFQLGSASLTKSFLVTQGLNRLEVWYLLDTDIPAGSNAFAISATGNAPGDTSIAFASFENVDQTTPISDTQEDSSTSTQTLSVTVTTEAGGLVVFACNQQRAGSATWTGPTEQWDVNPSGAYIFSGAHEAHASGGTDNGSATVTASAGRMIIGGFEISPSGGAPPATQSTRRRKVLLGGK